MSGTAGNEQQNKPDLNELLLVEVGRETPDAGALAGILARAVAEQVPDRQAMAEMVLDAVAERGDVAACRAVVQAVAAAGVAADRIVKTLFPVSKDRLWLACLKNAGFTQQRVTEAARRLEVLLCLAEGTFVFDRTWGFGTVKRVDEFYEKIITDFEQRPGHSMTMAYAAETLQVLGEDHLLVRQKRDPEAIRRMATETPGALVKLVLASFGAMPIHRLQELVTARVIGADGWKSFWEGARRQLKNDPAVEIPAKRSENLRLLARTDHFDADWQAAHAAQRDLAEIVRNTQEWIRRVGKQGKERPDRAVLGARLDYLTWSSATSDPALAARGYLLALDCGYTLDDALPLCPERQSRGDAPGVTIADRLATFLDAVLLMRTLNDLAVKDAVRFLGVLVGRCGDACRELLAARIGEMPMGLVSDVVRLLEGTPSAATAVRLMGEAIRGQSAGPELLSWSAQNLEALARLTGASGIQVALLMIDGLESPTVPVRYKNLYKELYDDEAWFGQVIGAAGAGEVIALMKRVRGCLAWNATDQRSILLKVLRKRPELQAALTETPVAEAPADAVLLTSWRSYRERQEILRKLVEVDIPQNSRAIAQARSYGDLRENFEYAAAKDEQRILMKRQEDLERELKTVKGTGFEGVSLAEAGMGTCVRVNLTDGSVLDVCILGEWDRDEALGVVPVGSVLAKALIGRKPGDDVALPGATPHDPARAGRIVTVSELPEAVRAWVRANPV